LLWVGKERTIESFRGFFTTVGEEIASRIVFICSDMWEPYLKVIRENCSETLHILDRFHIVAKMSKGRTPLLKKSRWLLLKREENLKEEQRFRLRDLLRYNLKTFSRRPSNNSGSTTPRLGRQIPRRVVPPNHAFPHRAHEEVRPLASPGSGAIVILNYFRAQKLISSGVVEGLNNKAKVTMRKSYGFRTCRVFELALYHSLGKLPEPVSTHDFF
jgi:transposase